MKRQSAEGGFTLIEVVFGVVIMAIMVAAIGNLFVSNLATVTLGKSKALALAVANERMEYLRDLPYDSLATQTGEIYPPGNIPDDLIVVRNNYKFRIHTVIKYVDDPYDGYITCPCSTGPAAGKSKDLYNYDYKKADVSVFLQPSNLRVARLTSDLSSKAAETATNTGILSITVLKANGQPLQGATVTIVNLNPTPDVNITATTDNNGLVTIPGLPPDSSNRYQVTATYPGYSTDGTIPDPPLAQLAVQLNPNVLAQQVTPITFSIDQLSTLYLHVTDTNGSAMNNLAITTTGAKKTKTNPNVYKYTSTINTDSSGNITLSGLEWDSYSFGLPSGYSLVTASPYAPITLDPNDADTVNLVVSNSGSYPRITAASPMNAQTGTSSVSLKLTGANLSSSTTLKLKKSGQGDITGTSCVSAGGNTTLTCNVNLTSAATGNWDIVATSGANVATQTGGFNVNP